MYFCTDTWNLSPVKSAEIGHAMVMRERNGSYDWTRMACMGACLRRRSFRPPAFLALAKPTLTFWRMEINNYAPFA